MPDTVSIASLLIKAINGSRGTCAQKLHWPCDKTLTPRMAAPTCHQVLLVGSAILAEALSMPHLEDTERRAALADLADDRCSEQARRAKARRLWMSGRRSFRHRAGTFMLYCETNLIVLHRRRLTRLEMEHGFAELEHGLIVRDVDDRGLRQTSC